MHLNSYNAPIVNVVSNFNENNVCELKFEAILNRAIDSDINGLIKYDFEDNKYLEIEDKNRGIKSYWYCREIIFYKK